MLHWLFYETSLLHPQYPVTSLDLDPRAVERRPDTPNTLVDTGDGLAQLLVLLAVAIPQHLSLFPHALVLQVLDADGPCGAVDVVGDDDGVLARPRANGELDGGVARGKGGERRLDEGVHALGGAPPVAVVELEAFALEDEGADAILGVLADGLEVVGRSIRTWAFATVRVAARGMLAVDDGVVMRCGVAACPSTSKTQVTCSTFAWNAAASVASYSAASTTSPHLSSPLYNTAAGAHSSTSSKMTYQLPPMLLNLFAPRPPLRWVEPIDHAPEKRCTPKISGVAQYLEAMREYKDNDGYVPTDSWLQKRDRKKIEKKEKQERLLTDGVKDCTRPTCTTHSIHY